MSRLTAAKKRSLESQVAQGKKKHLLLEEKLKSLREENAAISSELKKQAALTIHVNTNRYFGDTYRVQVDFSPEMLFMGMSRSRPSNEAMNISSAVRQISHEVATKVENALLEQIRLRVGHAWV
ncbi:MAG: hypothetical protein EBW87_01145 [Burkholderiaceae bacterium]|nr:hypothetical protein [Burkholderiaceae bacterium]